MRAVELKLTETQDTANATQETVTALQRSIIDLTQAVHTLQASFDHHNQQLQEDEDEG
ncbi:hypothetical protein JBE27_57215 [Streptomyces albiflaviniger]|nr:hypothetical protein [Streptomyces albiflaviniger]